MFCSTLGLGQGQWGGGGEGGFGGFGGGKKEVEKATFPTLLTMIVVKTTLGLIYLYTPTIKF